LREAASNVEARRIGGQLFEADESEYWLMLLKRAGMAKGAELDGLVDEAGQLVGVFTASQKTAIVNLEKEKQTRRKERLALRKRKITQQSTFSNPQ
jgi:hypothetical protein